MQNRHISPEKELFCVTRLIETLSPESFSIKRNNYDLYIEEDLIMDIILQSIEIPRNAT
jgi:hypothetical protein